MDELRRVLFRVLGVWFVLAIGYFIAMPYLFDNVILAPCHNDFIFYDLLRWIGPVSYTHLIEIYYLCGVASSWYIIFFEKVNGLFIPSL